MAAISNLHVVMKRLFMLVLTLLGVSISLYSQTEDTDYSSYFESLDEIVFTAPEISRSGNKTSYFPSTALVSISNSTSIMLAGLQIPELSVNPASGSVELIGGGNLSIRINGRPASASDLKSIRPEDISKVDYITSPGMRYGDADAVLDISVRQPVESGYSISAKLLQSPNRGWGEYEGSMKYNVGKSEWSIDYQSNPMWNMYAHRDNVEAITLSDGTQISRIEKGIDVPTRSVTHRAAAQYSYADGRNTLLNIQARLFRTNNLGRMQGEITTTYGDFSQTNMEYEEAPELSWQGDLDIYFYHAINNRHSFYVNLVPTIIDSDTKRLYSNDLTEINNAISSRGYRLLGEAVWEWKALDNGTFSSGLRSNGSWNKSHYLPSDHSLRQDDFSHNAFVEWKQTFGMWQYSVATAVDFYQATNPSTVTYLGFNPRLNITFNPFYWGGMSLTLNTTTITPGINELNPVKEQIDSYQWSVGNSELKPYQRYDGKLEFNFRYDDKTAKITVRDSYNHNPIMTAKSYVGNEIVRTPYNAGFNNEFELRGDMRIPIIKDRLTFTGMGGWHSYTSEGLNYRHNYAQPFVSAQLMFMKDSWWGMVKYNSTYNKLWGEMVTAANQNLLVLSLGYTYKSATFMAGVTNPFGNVKLKSQDLSSIAGFDRMIQVSGSNQLLWAGISLSIHHGKGRNAIQKKTDNQRQYESIGNVKK